MTTEARWVIVDPDGQAVSGPYDRAELRRAILEDVADPMLYDDPEDDADEEVAFWTGLTDEELLHEYADTYGVWYAELGEPTEEWRASTVR